LCARGHRAQRMHEGYKQMRTTPTPTHPLLLLSPLLFWSLRNTMHACHTSSLVEGHWLRTTHRNTSEVHRELQAGHAKRPGREQSTVTHAPRPSGSTATFSQTSRRTISPAGSSRVSVGRPAPHIHKVAAELSSTAAGHTGFHGMDNGVGYPFLERAMEGRQ
jgi:hypothetical protein